MLRHEANNGPAMKCSSCQQTLQAHYKFCPNCREELLGKQPCPSCGTLIDPGQGRCPFCSKPQTPAVSFGDNIVAKVINIQQVQQVGTDSDKAAIAYEERILELLKQGIHPDTKHEELAEFGRILGLSVRQRRTILRACLEDNPDLVAAAANRSQAPLITASSPIRADRLVLVIRSGSARQVWFVIATQKVRVGRQRHHPAASPRNSGESETGPANLAEAVRVRMVPGRVSGEEDRRLRHAGGQHRTRHLSNLSPPSPGADRSWRRAHAHLSETQLSGPLA